MFKIALNYSYVGALIISILGNFLPFIPIPYLLAIYYMASYLPVDPVVLGFASGFGGAIGKSVIYVLGFESSRIVINDEVKRKQVEKFREILGKYGAIAVFFATVTPSPDDVVIIPLGLIKYSFRKFFIATLAGKTLLSIFIAVSGRYFTEYLKIVFGEGSIYGIIVSIVIMILITVMILKTDWIKVADIIGKEGIKGIVRIITERRWKELLIESKKG